MLTPHFKTEKPPYNYKRRMSHSSITSFKYSPERHYQKYVIHGECKREKDGIPAYCVIARGLNVSCPQVQTSPELTFGSIVDKKLQDDLNYLPEIVRYEYLQYELDTEFDGIPLIGFPDALQLNDFTAMRDYKTGRVPWTQKRADETQQLTMYLLQLWQMHKIKPEAFELYIDWMPTHIHEGEVAFVDNMKPIVFKTKRTMTDILRFGQEIKNIRQAMIDYYEAHD